MGLEAGDAEHPFDQGIGVFSGLPFADYQQVYIAGHAEIPHAASEVLNKLLLAKPRIEDPHGRLGFSPHILINLYASSWTYRNLGEPEG